MARKLLRILLIAIAAGCFLYAGVWFAGGQIKKNADRTLAQRLHNAQAAPISKAPEASATAATPSPAPLPLADLYPDIPHLAGWITIDGTAIDYPYVQYSDNDRYLSTDIYGKNDTHGAIFADSRCEEGSSLLILYGHHMRDGTMFHDLSGYKDPAYAEAHAEILLYGLDGAAALYRVADMQLWNADRAQRTPFFEEMLSLAQTAGRDLLCLTTCDYSAEDVRLVVIAQRE